MSSQEKLDMLEEKFIQAYQNAEPESFTASEQWRSSLMESVNALPLPKASNVVSINQKMLYFACAACLLIACFIFLFAGFDANNNSNDYAIANLFVDDSDYFMGLQEPFAIS